MAGSSKKLSEPESFQITLPRQAYDYLTYLAWQGRGGSTIQEVARQILVEILDRRLCDGWHKHEVPVPTAPIPKEEPAQGRG
jgi:hypothetical protein